jgi:hypothetical protein
MCSVLTPAALLWCLQLIPPELVSAYKRAMLNIHPGLLPSFGGKGLYGERVHAAVIKSGARWAQQQQPCKEQLPQQRDLQEQW